MVLHHAASKKLKRSTPVICGKHRAFGFGITRPEALAVEVWLLHCFPERRAKPQQRPERKELYSSPESSIRLFVNVYRNHPVCIPQAAQYTQYIFVTDFR